MSRGPSPSLNSPTKKGLRAGFSALVARLRGGELTRARLLRSVALGLFIGCTPLYGIHIWLVLSIATPLRLDVLVAYLASNISIPPMIPFLLFAEAQVGTFLLEGRFLELALHELAPTNIFDLSLAVALGSLIVGLIVAFLGTCVVWLFAKNLKRHSAPKLS